MGSRNYRGGGKPSMSQNADLIESMNQTMAESLSSKVGQLKSLAIDLDSEARDHLPLLDGVDDDMETGSGRLGNSSGRLRNVGRGRMSGRKLTCFVGLSVTTVMIVIYYILLPMAWK